MRNGQNKRMRGRNRKSHNPLTRVYESNGPDVKIRGTASHVAEKYVQLARDAQSSGDPVGAENYFQHAEHYFRLIAAAQEQFRQAPSFYRPDSPGGEMRDEAFDDGDDEGMGQGMGQAMAQPPTSAGEQPSFGTRDPQPYIPRDAQFYPAREQQFAGRAQSQPRGEDDGNVDRLPSFITGGQQPQQSPQSQQAQPPQQGQNGYDNQGDRFPLHRRRRRHRGPRGDLPQSTSGLADGGDDGTPPFPRGE